MRYIRNDRLYQMRIIFPSHKNRLRGRAGTEDHSFPLLKRSIGKDSRTIQITERGYRSDITAWENSRPVALKPFFYILRMQYPGNRLKINRSICRKNNHPAIPIDSHEDRLNDKALRDMSFLGNFMRRECGSMGQNAVFNIIID